MSTEAIQKAYFLWPGRRHCETVSGIAPIGLRAKSTARNSFPRSESRTNSGDTNPQVLAKANCSSLSIGKLAKNTGLTGLARGRDADPCSIGTMGFSERFLNQLAFVHAGNAGFDCEESVITRSMSSPAIVVESVKKYFPRALSGWRAYIHLPGRATECALAGVSFEVAAGEAVAIIGPNGAGKSTLLRILATLLIPSSGHAAMDGFDVEKNSAGARRKLGYYTGGDDGFYGRLSARENLEFFAVMNNQVGAEVSREIERLAGWMGFTGSLDRQVRTFSTGMIHRLGLARALLHRPKILLLDEPTRSLDPIAASEFRRFLRQELVQQQGATLLFATHTLREVENIADRVLVLDAGRVAACDSPAALSRAVGTFSFEDAIARLLGRSDLASGSSR